MQEVVPGQPQGWLLEVIEHILLQRAISNWRVFLTAPIL